MEKRFGNGVNRTVHHGDTEARRGHWRRLDLVIADLVIADLDVADAETSTVHMYRLGHGIAARSRKVFEPVALELWTAGDPVEYCR